MDALLKYPFHQKNANGFIFNVAGLGVVAQYDEPGHMINMLDDSDFGINVSFCGGRKLESPEKNSQSQIEINQSQPMYQPWIKPGMELWKVQMMTSAPT